MFRVESKFLQKEADKPNTLVIDFESSYQINCTGLMRQTVTREEQIIVEKEVNGKEGEK